jgi:HEAT repeats
MPRPSIERRVTDHDGPGDLQAGPASTPAGVERFLQQLARALHKFRTYPSDSPFCIDAVSAARRSLASIDGLDTLDARVTQRELIVDGCGIGAGTVIERELARQLHRASVARLRIHCDATHTELAQFCSALVQTQRDEGAALPDLLVEQGVEHIEAEATLRPEIVEISGDAGTIDDTVQRERTRRAALSTTDAAVHNLYPQDRGWIRVDPTSSFSSVSLAELAILVEDPNTLAAILLRLSGETPALDAAGAALGRKFSDLATVFASLDPNLARVKFARLSKAVRDLAPPSRTRLLKETILPGLLDGRPDGLALQDFPDVELADALGLLLDLETASPEVLNVALTRLDLPADRQEAVLPLLNDRLRARDRWAGKTPGAQTNQALVGYAQRLIEVTHGQAKGFADFSAFDVSMDGATVAAVETIRDVVINTDEVDQQIKCLCSLIRLESHADRVQAYLFALTPLMAALEQGGQPEAGLKWLVTLHEIARSIESRRPEVAKCVGAAIQSLFTGERAAWLAEMHRGEPVARAVVTSYINALAPAIAPAFAALFDERRLQADLPSVTNMVCDHAAALAPGLLAELGHTGPAATRAIVRVLACAGGGHEDLVAGFLTHEDAMLRREALEALVRMGTPQAARIVADQILVPGNPVLNTAVEAMWRFPSSLVSVQLRTILRRDDFVARNPETVVRLLKRAQADGARGFEPEIQHLASLRRRFWRPALMRVGFAARQLISS